MRLAFAMLMGAATCTGASPDNDGADTPRIDSSGDEPVLRLSEVVVTGRQDSLLDIADSASQGATGVGQLEDRPLLRSGEVLEAIPGVIITQHAGGGKANQYFLRGFNLDHGTDFAVFLDGMPLNLPSHAHGEGYADMNTVIPEFIERIDWEKGPYSADVGNYGSAGSAQLVFYNALPRNFLTLETGSFGYERAVLGASSSQGSHSLLVGAELYHDNGPWDHADDYRKFNGIIKYTERTNQEGFSVCGRIYAGIWNSSDQVPEDFAAHDFFGAINPSDGGRSDRESLQAEWHRATEDAESSIVVYGFHYYLDLFSDFTYFLTDPVKGDQFEQQDDRWVGGLDARHTAMTVVMNRPVKTTVGVQLRNDSVNNGLYQTELRSRVEKLDAITGTALPATTEADHFTDTQAGVFAESQVQWSANLRFVLGLRGDWARADVTSLADARNSGAASEGLLSPKLSVVFNPCAKTEFYLQGGYSLHSNDVRGATQAIQPVSADNPYPDIPSQRIPLLIRTRGAEIGIRTLAVQHLQSTISLWCLHSDSELQQDGDTGGTVPSRSPSNRYGIEWANYLAATSWLSFDFDAAYSVARFTEIDGDDAAPGSLGGENVPEAVRLVMASGVTLHPSDRIAASLRLRYFGPRDLTSDGIYQSRSTTLVNAQASYRLNRTWTVAIEGLNFLNRRDHDIDYAYQLRTTPTAPSLFQKVFHPVEPLQVRFSLTRRL
jgi:outer membrane receptor protein involved in Fe transport